MVVLLFGGLGFFIFSVVGFISFLVGVGLLFFMFCSFGLFILVVFSVGYLVYVCE